jgi:pimeloyl-ACP methyl ester carboxylesterase
MDGDIEELRRDPSAIAGLGLGDIVDHYEGIIQGLEEPPIIMGHSFGGLITQILIDRDLGAAGVAIDSAAAKGVLLLPFSTIKVTFPALRNPANVHKAAALTPEQFHYAFGNNLSEEESLKVYERYAVPGPDHVLFKEFPERSHYTLGEPGWEEVADYALTWAVENAGMRQVAAESETE